MIGALVAATVRLPVPIGQDALILPNLQFQKNKLIRKWLILATVRDPKASWRNVISVCNGPVREDIRPVWKFVPREPVSSAIFWIPIARFHTFLKTNGCLFSRRKWEHCLGSFITLMCNMKNYFRFLYRCVILLLDG